VDYLILAALCFSAAGVFAYRLVAVTIQSRRRMREHRALCRSVSQSVMLERARRNPQRYVVLRDPEGNVEVFERSHLLDA
jgi:hypothetical protein